MRQQWIRQTLKLKAAFISCGFLASCTQHTPMSLTLADVPISPATPTPALTPEERLAQQGNVGIRVHDPSTIIACKGMFYVFSTGQGIQRYRSKDLLKWDRMPPVFTQSPAWIARTVPNNNGLDFWAPDIIPVGGKYFLYYSVSTFGKRVSAIGLATNTTLDPADPAYRWMDQGIVISSTQESDFNAIDPAPFMDADGKLWLSFGSFWSGIRLIQLDPATGRRIKPDSPNTVLAHAGEIEASYIYHHDKFYYLFVNWGQCCKGINSTYTIRVGRSEKPTGPYLDKAGKDMRDGGGTLVLGTDGNFIGPGHAGIVLKEKQEYISMHFYDGSRRGMSALAIRPLTWTPQGWPAVGPVTK